MTLQQLNHQATQLAMQIVALSDDLNAASKARKLLIVPEIVKKQFDLDRLKGIIEELEDELRPLEDQWHKDNVYERKVK